jgi:DNA-binding GntR family transcriptional regulator
LEVGDRGDVATVWPRDDNPLENRAAAPGRCPSVPHPEVVVTTGPFSGAVGHLGRRTAHEYAREAIRRAILRGDLIGGSRVIQTEIAQQLKLSTTPVREAIRDLVTQGLISHDPHRGGIVRELNWEEMHDIVVIRRGLDRTAAELAMEHITDAQIDQAEAIASRLEEEHDLGGWVELNEQFHLVFHEATGSWRLTGILKSLEEAAGVYVAQAQRLHPDIRQAAVEQHRTIIDAYRRRDAEAVANVMVEHVSLPVKSIEGDV